MWGPPALDEDDEELLDDELLDEAPREVGTKRKSSERSVTSFRSWFHCTELALALLPDDELELEDDDEPAPPQAHAVASETPSPVHDAQSSYPRSRW